MDRLHQLTVVAEQKEQTQRIEAFKEALDQTAEKLGLKELPNIRKELELGAAEAEGRNQDLKKKVNLLIIAAVTGMVIIITIMSLLWLKTNTTRQNPLTLNQTSNSALEQEMPARLSQLQKDIATASERWSQLNAGNVKTQMELDARQKALETIQRSIADSTTQLQSLQKLQTKFQFRLLPDQNGKVFVQILDSSRPFQVNGQTFIELPQELP
jgi:hypothetical protein